MKTRLHTTIASDSSILDDLFQLVQIKDSSAGCALGEESSNRQASAGDCTFDEQGHRPVRAVRRALGRPGKRLKDERIPTQANLLDLTQEAIVVRTMHDQIVFWNQGAEMLFGWKPKEARGQRFCQWLGGESPVFDAAMAHLLDFDSWNGELKLHTRTGEERIVSCRWSLLRDKHGQPAGIFSTHVDLTEKRSMEAALLRMQRMDSLGALARGIMHDLNNCLAPVVTSAELLKCPECDAEKERCLEIITSSARQATEMVGQILNFARGTSGESEPVPVQRLVYNIARMMRDTFPKSMEINARPPGNRLWTVHGIAIELYQVLLNLCVNARDAMPRGGQLLLSAENVALSSAEAKAICATPGTYVRLSVADTGDGIPGELLPRIFEPFFTTKSAGKGTGLGLSTVASIVAHHRGFIDIKTEPGKGTDFRIYLPAMAPADAREHVHTARPKLSALNSPQAKET